MTPHFSHALVPMRTFEKSALILELNLWVEDSIKLAQKNPDKKIQLNQKIIWAKELKVKIERESSQNLTLKQVEEIFRSIQSNRGQFLSEAALVISETNPGENPISRLKDFAAYSIKEAPSAEDFENSRHYTNKNSSIKANPASLDEAANHVEAKIFKDSIKDSAGDEKDDNENPDEDLI
jgi:hypothetical protein